MKILHVVASMNLAHGGVSQAIRGMISPLSDLNCQSEIASSDHPTDAWIASESFVTHAVGNGSGPWNKNPALYDWLKNNYLAYDAVIIHGLWLYHSFAVRKVLDTATSKELPKCYVMPHGMLDPWFQKLSVRPVKTVRNWIFWKLIEQRVVNSADGLLFTCAEEMRLARLPFRPYRPRTENVVGLGVNTPPAFQPPMKATFTEKCPTLENRPYLLFLSRIDPKKGVDLLIRAYAALLNDIPEEKKPQCPRLVIAGPGLETAYGQEMQELASSLCPSNSIIWPGMLTGDAKWGAFYGCEAFVLPSHQENFGIAVGEALACDKPVLITNKVNIYREIESAGAGIISDDTLEGTVKLLRDWTSLSTTEKDAITGNAKPCFEKYFQVESAAAKLRDVLLG